MSKSRRGLKILFVCLGVVALLAVALVLAIDPMTRRVAERKFERVDGMTCRIDGADFRVFERKIVLEGFHFNPEGGGAPEDMLYAETFVIDARGPMLAKKSTKSHLTLTGVEVHVRKSSDPAKDQSSLSEQALEDIKNISRWGTDELHVEDATVRYVDDKKGLDIEMTKAKADVTNVSAARDPFERDRASWAVFGVLEGKSKANFHGSAQLGVPSPDFAIDGEITGFPLKSINGLIRRRIGVAAVDGYIALGVHLDGTDGTMKGTLSPRFRHLEFDAELDDELRKALVAWGLPIVGKVVEDPVAPRPGNTIQVKGRYGEGQPLELEATREENSWLQNKVLSVRTKSNRKEKTN